MSAASIVMRPAHPASPDGDVDWSRVLGRSGDPTLGAPWRLGVVVVLAHVVVLAGLLQVDAVRDTVRDAAPVLIDLVAPPAPEATAVPARSGPAPLQPPPRRAARPMPSHPVPGPETTAPIAAAAPAAAEPQAPPPAALTAHMAAEPPPAAAASAAAPTAPPAPPPSRKSVSASAVRYLTLPPVEVPRLSRRARESGTVLLRVLVDVRGLPQQVRVERTSGHARLDEQALWAMRQARFEAPTENGQPVELDVLAPIEYVLE